MSLSHSVRLVIVVSHKWVEGPELHPSYTQLLCGVASKATDVRPHKWHPEQTELQHRWGGESGAKCQSKSTVLNDLWSTEKKIFLMVKRFIPLHTNLCPS